MIEDDDEEAMAELSVEEQVALMYLGSVDEGVASAIAQRIVEALMPTEVDATPPRNADVLYALITAQTSVMARMGGTADFRATILRGFGDISAGQLLARLAPKPKTRPPKGAKPKKPAPAPRREPEDPPDDLPPERGPPRPYTERVAGDVDLYTLDEFRAIAGELDDRAGYACQACKLGSGLAYYAPERKVKAADFGGAEEPRLLPGTSHIAWIVR